MDVYSTMATQIYEANGNSVARNSFLLLPFLLKYKINWIHVTAPKSKILLIMTVHLHNAWEL